MRNLKQISLKINHILFWWYYKRVPEFFHQWPMLKSISLLKQNYEHALFIKKGLNGVISGAVKREGDMRQEISNLKLKLMGISQSDVDSINAIFGTNLKGKSKEENEN